MTVNKPSLSSSKPTVIIAAYNEASVIRNTLSLLTDGENQNRYQIMVVCNGCTDNTDEIIQQEFESVFYYSIAQASKALAIRHAESFKPGFPRLYLDADIELATEDAVALFDVAGNQENASLIIPGSQVNTLHCQTIVKRFYRVWYTTPFVQQLGFGAGAYLLNRSGRNRFTEWPELIADDGFVRSQFHISEICVSNRHQVQVKAPRNICTLIRVKARSKLGNIELKHYLKGITRNITSENSTTKKHVLTATKFSTRKVDKLVYFFVNLTALIIAKWQFFTGYKSWSRDNSNR